MNKNLKRLLPVVVLLAIVLYQKYGSLSTSPEPESADIAPQETGSLLPQWKEGSGQFIEHEGYSLLFDPKTLCPRWVAWELTAEETRGRVSREGVNFKADESVPKACQVEMWDYNGGQYGRGHMCPAGDMKWSQGAMHDCHYMTNICPQTAELNKTWWEHLERACRQWARQEGSIWIMCGPVFSDSPRRFGKKHKVAVPKGFYKVVLSQKEGREKALGFYYTNDDAPQPMEDAVRSVDEIEQITGIDFFSALPDDKEDRLEAMTDLRAWDK